MATDEHTSAERARDWRARLDPYLKRAGTPRPLVVEGRLVRMVGLTLEASGCRAAVGDRCHVARLEGGHVLTEVVGFSADRLLLMPIGELRGLAPGASVVPVGRGDQVGVGEQLLGRVVDGTGQPIDGKGPLRAAERASLLGRPIKPSRRRPMRAPLDVGVRSINALLTVGRGQRLGLFAAAGAGTSALLGMMTRFADADVVVVAMIGERSREVNEFVANNLCGSGMKRAVVVVSPADDPPLLRLQGASLATRVAEYFRDRGQQVLLLMDSLTRFAHAHREVALAAGEPPATRGYPPSVFARVPQLVERAGNGDHDGAITAFYTLLTDDDDRDEPLAEAARAILDGQVVLSRELAEQGHFPAIDLEASISRAMTEITDDAWQAQARRFRRLHSTSRRHADLIDVGACANGADGAVDAAIAMRPRLLEFLRQDLRECVDLEASRAALARLVDSCPEPS